MLTIIEGTECVGKTTLAKLIAEKTGAEYQHYGAPSGDAYSHFSPALLAAQSGKGIVCDRHLIGEKIYAKVKKTPSQWAEGDYERMLQELNDMHATIIFCWDYGTVLRKRHTETGETFITPKQMMTVQSLFEKEIKRIAETYKGIIVIRYRPTANYGSLL